MKSTDRRAAAVASDPRAIKRRRRTKAEMQAIRDSIFDVLEAENPMTVRQTFYALTVIGAIPKNKAGYNTAKRLLAEMRRSGDVPYTWIADHTRWMRKPRTFDSMEEALRITAEAYRQALWSDSSSRVEIWLEKDALAGVVYPITDEWDVPLMVTKGYPSMSFTYSAAVEIAERHNHGQETFIYYLGDHDASGLEIDKKIVHSIGESLISLLRLDKASFQSAFPSPCSRTARPRCLGACGLCPRAAQGGRVALRAAPPHVAMEALTSSSVGDSLPRSPPAGLSARAAAS